jgi:hypothetical protein
MIGAIVLATVVENNVTVFQPQPNGINSIGLQYQLQDNPHTLELEGQLDGRTANPPMLSGQHLFSPAFLI